VRRFFVFWEATNNLGRLTAVYHKTEYLINKLRQMAKKFISLNRYTDKSDEWEGYKISEIRE